MYTNFQRVLAKDGACFKLLGGSVAKHGVGIAKGTNYQPVSLNLINTNLTKHLQCAQVSI